MLSGTAEYALRAVLYLAEDRGDRAVQVGEIATALAAPQNYLSKILHQLTRNGVLESSRGKHGGFRLAVPPSELSLLTVVNHFDHVAGGRTCLLGRNECSDHSACAVHWRWKDVSERLAVFFRQTTVADLLVGASPPG